MTIAATLGLLDFHLSQRKSTGLGRGIDYYFDEWRDHPMAYALYARACLNLHRMRRAKDDLDIAQDAIQRLSQLAWGSPPAWGLGFPSRGLAPDQPYAITTALCALAFIDNYNETGDRHSFDMAIGAGRWLTDVLPWRRAKFGVGPCYAPDLKYVVPNVASMVGGALARLHNITGAPQVRKAAMRARRFVLRAQAPAGFWSYGSTGQKPALGLNPALTVDAVHMGYTIDGCCEMAAAGTDDGTIGEAVQAGHRFLARELVRADGVCLEKVVPVRLNDRRAIRLLENPRLDKRPIDDQHVLVGFPQESRLWGYGALLGASARSAHAGMMPEPSTAEQLLSRLLNAHFRRADGRISYLPTDPRAFPRHEAHALEGITAWLSAVRRTGRQSGLRSRAAAP